ncbi:MAG: zinc-binding dehydrogenase [Rhizobiales bacterium]|nr:zinc-binding dehydrogenase [Hyphomicrobiales bacterium]
MKAAILESRGKDGLRIGDFADPKPAPGEAVMKVRAGGINRIDLYMRDSGKGITHELPIVLGVDGAGEIVEVPEGSHLKVGDPVILYPMAFCGRCAACNRGDQINCIKFDICGETRHGTFAEYIAMPDKCFLPKPDSISWEAAATLPVAYLTAWRMMFGKAPLRSAETILIMGVAGGVSSACLQMATMIGAEAIVTSSTDEKLAWAKGLGAAHGINYRNEKVAKRVMEITQGRGVDMVIDNVGDASWGDSLRSLRSGGRLVTCGATTGAHPSADIQRMFARQLTVYGSTLGGVEEFRALIDVVARGKIEPIIDKVFKLDDIASGFDRMDRGEHQGNLVVDIDC